MQVALWCEKCHVLRALINNYSSLYVFNTNQLGVNVVAVGRRQALLDELNNSVLVLRQSWIDPAARAGCFFINTPH